jgi:hypothetical protein
VAAAGEGGKNTAAAVPTIVGFLLLLFTMVHLHIGAFPKLIKCKIGVDYMSSKFDCIIYKLYIFYTCVS